MNEILQALGRCPTLWQRARVFGLIGAAALGFLAVRYVAYAPGQLNPVLLQLAGWTAWFTWQGWLFARNRERYIRQGPETAYRKAFYRNIVFGLGFWKTQMAAPVFWAVLSGPALTDAAEQGVLGVLFIGAGVGLLYLGFSTIGLDGAGFLYEYRPVSRPFKNHSVYSYLRHPLFVGGVLASAGTGLLFDNPGSLSLGIVNVAVLPVYAWLEDSRQLRVFGETYRQYMDAVGGVIPRPGAVARAVVGLLGPKVEWL